MSLEINISSLDTEALKFSAPAQSKFASEKIKNRFLEWTRNEKNGASDYYRSLKNKEGLEESKKIAATLKNYQSMIVIGIGGSSLGAKCIYDSLKLSKKLKKLFFLENIDPLFLDDVLDQVDLDKTAVALITKSGGTIETMGNFSVLWKKIKKEQLVAITDPNSGALRSWCEKEKITTLSVPPGVGGRFSVFTPVGLLPLAFAGVDVDQLVIGAVDVMSSEKELDKILALSSRTLDLYEQGLTTHVIMPYSCSLASLGAWCVQLIGESIGKKGARGKRVGITPLAAVGATDQHSLLQLLMEGPNSFVSHIIKVKDWNCEHKFEKLPKEFEKLNFANGKGFDEILNAEANATQMALEKSGRPTIEFYIDTHNEKSIGAILGFYMDYTSMLGAGLEINPYDQPGVELGKVILKEVL